MYKLENQGTRLVKNTYILSISGNDSTAGGGMVPLSSRPRLGHSGEWLCTLLNFEISRQGVRLLLHMERALDGAYRETKSVLGQS